MNLEKKSHKPTHQGRRPSSGTPKHQVRIIGGLWKRTLLPVLDLEGLRPTPDRVRETVFNWLDHLFARNWRALRVLDLFAGSGALGFEAASRGAAAVLLVEQSSAITQQLLQVKAKLQADQVTVLRADGVRYAQGLAGAAVLFDLIFIDPPYQQQEVPQLLALCASLLAPNGLVYLESDRPLTAASSSRLFAENVASDGIGDLRGWEIIRADRAGAAFFHLLQRKNELSNQA